MILRAYYSFIFFLSLILLSFFFSGSSFANSDSFYSFNAEPYYLNRMNYTRQQNPWDFRNPPPSKTYDILKKDYDTLVFLLSVQGIVNRYRSNFYLYHHDIDKAWISNLKKQRVWPWFESSREIPLSDLDSVINAFKNDYDIKGSVSWDIDKPFTLNLAVTVAGAENYVVVRKDSPLYSQITTAFPLKMDLSEKNFSDKQAGYYWLRDEYLLTNKVKPILAYFKDGYPLKLYNQQKMFDLLPDNTPIIEAWGIMMHDVLISNKAFVFDLSPHPGIKDPNEPESSENRDRETLQNIIDSIRANNIVPKDKLIEFWGYPNRKYLTRDCNEDGRVTESDGVLCLEWEFVRYVSLQGGVKRMGGGEAYGVDSPNLSFFKHGPGADFIAQSSSITPEKLLQKNYVAGYPNNFSFENDSTDGSWNFDTTNKVVYAQGTPGVVAPSHGTKYLEVNVSQADLNKHNHFYQDIPINLLKGYRYRFVIQARSSGGEEVKGIQAVWAWKNNKPQLICRNAFTKSNAKWEPLLCEFDVKEDGFSAARLQIYVDTPDKNYSFDEAYFLGPNTLKVNPNKKFFLNYAGDFDFVNFAYIMPFLNDVGDSRVWYLPIWENRTSEDKWPDFPIAWGISAEISKAIPPIYNFFVKTKMQAEYFVTPDSGLGYLNSSYLPDNVVSAWKKESANAARQFGYKIGWALEGFNTGLLKNPDSDVFKKVRDIYKVIAPEGIVFSDVLNAPDFLSEGLAILPMDNAATANSFDEPHEVVVWAPKIMEMAGLSQDLIQAEKDQMDLYYQRSNRTQGKSWQDIHREYFPKIARQFFVFRNIFASPYLINKIAKDIKDVSAEVEIVDPYTFFYLFRLSKGDQSPAIARSSLVFHNVPTFMKVNESKEVSLTIRNDGWDIWVPKKGNNCNGGGEGHGCYRLSYGIKAGGVMPVGIGSIGPQYDSIHNPEGFKDLKDVELGRIVLPGESATFTFDLKAPSAAGTYSFQADMVKELEYAFEQKGNVPWQKIINVVDVKFDINEDGKVNAEDIDYMLGKYNQVMPSYSQNKITTIDILKAVKNETH